MSLFKGKRKKQYNKTTSNIIKTTIDNRHNQKMKEIDETNDTIQMKHSKMKIINSRLTEFETRSMDQLSDDEIRIKLDLIEERKYLEGEIDIINKDTAKQQYLLDTSHLLYEYFDDTHVHGPDKSIKTSGRNTSVLDFFHKNTPSPKIVTKYTKSTKNELMDEYLQLTDSNYVRNIHNISNEDIDNCKQCNVSRIRDMIHGCMVCPMCGCEEKILIDCDTPSYKEPPRELTYFAYKKINHANEWLSQFQAKESTDISEDIFDKILTELKKESYINLKQLNVDRVRDILKKLDLTKYYEHCHYITNRITGRPAPVITGDLEDKVRNMFKEIQGPWMKYCPSDRSNFFSYPYIFYKFFQLLDKDEYLVYCRLLKSREKLQEHDEVWKKICHDLKWQYIPTV
jgi:hypothetical protein